MTREHPHSKKRKLSDNVDLPIRSRENQDPTPGSDTDDDDFCDTCRWRLRIYAKGDNSCATCGQDPATCNNVMNLTERPASFEQLELKLDRVENELDECRDELRQALKTIERMQDGHGYERRPYKPRFDTGSMLGVMDRRTDTEELFFDLELHLNDQSIGRDFVIPVLKTYGKLRSRVELLYASTLREERVTAAHFVGFSVERREQRAWALIHYI